MNELESVVSAAERVLSSRRARDVRLADIARLSDAERRNLLVRCRDVEGGDSFVIKKVMAEAYNPDDATSWDTTRFFSDWAGAEFLSDILSTPRTAAFHGGDRAMGFFILEDLGQHRSLVEPLLEEGADSAEKALLAYGRMLLPSCWCANRLPDDLVGRMESVYRDELINGCPAAQDDRMFEEALSMACGAWMLNSLSRSLGRAIEADTTWGIATLRQRVLARLQAFISTTLQFDQLPALRGTASGLLDMLRMRWADTLPMPLYPAFRR